VTESKPDPGRVSDDAAWEDSGGDSAAGSADAEGPSGSNGEPAAGSERGAANGYSTEAPPRLPPPWERVPADRAAGSEFDRSSEFDGSDAVTGPDLAQTSAGHGPAGSSGYESAGYGSPTQRFDPTAETAIAPGSAVPPGPEVDRSEADVDPDRRLTDLGDARTVGVDSRVGAGIGGLSSGFGSGSAGAGLAGGSSSGGGSGVSSGGGSTPGGFPSGWPRNRRPRQANLQLKRLDPWSVLKIALVLSVVLYLVWMVAVGVLYGALDGIGVWDRLNGQYSDLVAEHAGDRLISAGRIFGFAAVVGAVNSLLVAVAFSVSAFIYNVSADLVGGIEVTLSERD
jgi:hypothetical protein